MPAPRYSLGPLGRPLHLPVLKDFPLLKSPAPIPSPAQRRAPLPPPGHLQQPPHRPPGRRSPSHRLSLPGASWRTALIRAPPQFQTPAFAAVGTQPKDKRCPRALRGRAGPKVRVSLPGEEVQGSPPCHLAGPSHMPSGPPEALSASGPACLWSLVTARGSL